MLIDEDGNLIIGQLGIGEESFYNLVITKQGTTGVYSSTGCNSNNENLGFDEVTGLHFPGNIICWNDNANVLWEKFIDILAEKLF